MHRPQKNSTPSPAKQAADAAALLLWLRQPPGMIDERAGREGQRQRQSTAQNKNTKSGRIKRDLKTRLYSLFLKKKKIEFCNSFFLFFLTDCFGELNSNERAQFLFLFLFVTLSFATLTCVLRLATCCGCGTATASVKQTLEIIMQSVKSVKMVWLLDCKIVYGWVVLGPTIACNYQPWFL